MTASTGNPTTDGRFEPPTVKDRAALGKAAREQAPRSAHGEWAPASDRPDPVALLEEQAGHPGPGAGSDPVRADARLPVHLLPRRRLPDGLRPGGRAAHRPHRAAVRRRSPVQLRHLPRPGPPTGLRPQRLRRDAARSLRVGREAAGRQLRGRRARPRLRRRAASAVNLAVAQSYRAGHAGPGHDEEAGRLVRPPRCGRDPGDAPRPGQGWPGQALREEHGQGAREGQHEGVQQAGRDGRRAAQAHRRSADDRAARGPVAGPAAPPGRGRPARPPALLPPQPARRPPAPDGGLPRRRTRRGRSWAWAAWALGPGSC